MGVLGIEQMDKSVLCTNREFRQTAQKIMGTQLVVVN